MLTIFDKCNIHSLLTGHTSILVVDAVMDSYPPMVTVDELVFKSCTVHVIQKYPTGALTKVCSSSSNSIYREIN